MSAARAAALIAAKDLRARVRDRSALLVAVVVPLVLAGIFSAVLPGDDTASRFKLAVFDGDRGVVGAQMTQALHGLERRRVISLRSAGSAAAAQRLVKDGDAGAALVIPAGLSRAVTAARPATLDVVGDIDHSISTLVAQSVASQFAGAVRAVQVAVVAALAAGDRRGPAALARAARSLPAPVIENDVSARDKRLQPASFYAAGLAVFFLFFTVQFGITSLLDERQGGTLARLLAAPIPARAVLVGKLATSLVLGLASMAVLVVATSLLLGAHWGNPLGVALLVVCGVLAATAITALIATVARTAEQAGTWQSMVALVLGMLGGSFFNTAGSGGVLGTVRLATPHAWFLRGIEDLTGGAGPGAALGPAAAMLAFAVVIGAVSFLRIGALARP